jgi:cytochrome c peroxidase
MTNKMLLSCVFLSLLSLKCANNTSGDTPQVSTQRHPPIPTDNPITPEKIHLGQKLFFDPRLSKDGTVSCNSCHNVMAGGDDNRSVSVGVGGKTGTRSAPTVWNAAFNPVQFWDGRAATLEDQAKGPLTNPVEMAMESHDAVVKRVASIPGYVSEFSKAFPGGDSLTIDNLARAIASYERTLITSNSRFDRYLNGDTTAISASAERGWKTVKAVGCTGCHSGSNFDGSTGRMGEGNYAIFPIFTGNDYATKYHLTEDRGRGAITMRPEDDHRFKIPTWRNVALTAPYFHNGLVPTLDEAVRVMARVQLNATLAEDQVQDVVAFLGTLTGEFPKQEMPQLPPTAGQSLIVH